VAADRYHSLFKRPSCLVDGHRGHRPLVYVQSDHDHCSRLQAVGGDRRADRPQSRPQGHAPIRSRSTVSVGGGDTTLDGQPFGATFGIESAAADRVCANNRTPPQRRRLPSTGPTSNRSQALTSSSTAWTDAGGSSTSVGRRAGTCSCHGSFSISCSSAL